MVSLKLLVLALFALSALVAIAAEQKPTSPENEMLFALAKSDFKAFAREVTKGQPSETGRVSAIAHWVTGNFAWKPTDYKKRTVPEVIERRGGNCDDMARVALAVIEELQIKTRRVHEVHIRTRSIRRGNDAQRFVKERGNQYSVFGTNHNDHVYLEFYDTVKREWLPADPWSGLVGMEEWMKGRVGFDKRSGPNPDAPDMIVPIAIFAEDDGGQFTVNRTQHYLVEGFDAMYRGKMRELTCWQEWVAELDRLDDRVKGAFSGTANLHEDSGRIEAILAIYRRLRAEYEKLA